MSNRNQRRKRHPLVRFIRSILKLIRAIFKPKKRPTRSIERSGSFDRLPADFGQVSQELPSVTEQIAIVPAPVIVTEQIATIPAIVTQDPFVETIGELFERVEWQMLPVPIPVTGSAPLQAVRTNLATPSSGSLETVGELLNRVKWQIPTATIQEKVISASRVVQTHDVSLN